MPPRCGDINIEPLMPFDLGDDFIADYVSSTLEDYSSYVLERGQCGKVGESKQEAFPHPNLPRICSRALMDCPPPPLPRRRRQGLGDEATHR